MTIKEGFVLMVLICAGLSACSLLQRNVAPRVAKAVQSYCAQPRESRLLVRQQVNELIIPNRVQVTCAGDPEGVPPQ